MKIVTFVMMLYFYYDNIVPMNMNHIANDQVSIVTISNFLMTLIDNKLIFYKNNNSDIFDLLMNGIEKGIFSLMKITEHYDLINVSHYQNNNYLIKNFFSFLMFSINNELTNKKNFSAYDISSIYKIIIQDKKDLYVNIFNNIRESIKKIKIEKKYSNILYLMTHFRFLKAAKKSPKLKQEKNIIEDLKTKINEIVGFHDKKKHRYNVAYIVLNDECNALQNIFFNNNELNLLNKFFCNMLIKRMKIIQYKINHVDAALLVIKNLSHEFINQLLLLK